MSRVQRTRFGFGVKGACVLLVLAGCRGKAVERPVPTMYPVKGKVAVSDGQLPPAGSIIEFCPTKGNAEFRAQGTLAADGSFELTTVAYDRKLPGAAEGPYQVTIYMSVNNAPAPPIEVQEPCTIAPKENDITVKVSASVIGPLLKAGAGKRR
jgi:hypothetical protein